MYELSDRLTNSSILQSMTADMNILYGNFINTHSSHYIQHTIFSADCIFYSSIENNILLIHSSCSAENALNSPHRR